MIITEKCVFDVDREAGLKLVEIADGVNVDDLKAATGCPFEVHTCVVVCAVIATVLLFVAIPCASLLME